MHVHEQHMQVARWQLTVLVCVVLLACLAQLSAAINAGACTGAHQCSWRGVRLLWPHRQVGVKKVGVKKIK